LGYALRSLAYLGAYHDFAVFFKDAAFLNDTISVEVYIIPPNTKLYQKDTGGSGTGMKEKGVSGGTELILRELERIKADNQIEYIGFRYNNEVVYIPGSAGGA
jgi:hypothetical protein